MIPQLLAGRREDEDLRFSWRFFFFFVVVNSSYVNQMLYGGFLPLESFENISMNVSIPYPVEV